MSASRKILPIAAIEIDHDILPRTADKKLVKEYAEDMLRCKFPPITVFELPNGIFTLADGLHRIDAHKIRELTDIACDVRKGNKVDAFLFASKANLSHGRKLKYGELTDIIIQFFVKGSPFSDDLLWSDTKIAAHLRCDRTSVGKIRNKLTQQGRIAPGHVKTANRAGKEYEIDTSKINKNKEAPEAKQTQPKSKGKKQPAESAGTQQEAKEPPKPNKSSSAPPNAGKPILDGLGEAVPGWLRSVFERRAEFICFQNLIGEAISMLESLKTDKTGAGSEIDLKEIVKLMSKARMLSRKAMPHIVCSECGGEQKQSCESCNGRGWIPQQDL